MAMNLMGQYKRPNEQDLVADLIEEAIEQRGVQVRYILRDMLNPDELFGEAPMSKFDKGFELPMFVESVEHFNGNGDLFDEFGISKTDSSIFQVGARKFRLEVTSDTAEVERPREGDLIYLPFSDSLWEINKVKMDIKYYQLGRNYTYRLVCKLFEYSHEEVNNPESDFAEYSTITELDDAGLKRLLEVGPGQEIDENGHIQQALEPYLTTPADDAFGF
jgi:hypothetical protein